MPKLLISQKKLIEQYVKEKRDVDTYMYFDIQEYYYIVAKRKDYETLWCDMNRYCDDYTLRLDRPELFKNTIEQFRKGWN